MKMGYGCWTSVPMLLVCCLCAVVALSFLDRLATFGAEFRPFRFGAAARANAGCRSLFYLGTAVRAKFSSHSFSAAFGTAIYHRLDHSSSAVRAEFGTRCSQRAVLRAASHLCAGPLGSFGRLLGFLHHIAETKGVGKAFYGCTRLSAA